MLCHGWSTVSCGGQVSSWEPPPEGEGVAGQWATEAGGEEDAKEVTELSDLGV